MIGTSQSKKKLINVMENTSRSMPAHGDQQNVREELKSSMGPNSFRNYGNVSRRMGSDPNSTSYLDVSQDVGIKGFSLLSNRLRRRGDINAMVNQAEPVSIRLFFQESCARLTLNQSEIRIDFDDIYSVAVQKVQDAENGILIIRTFANQNYHPKNCCGCSKKVTLRKRVLAETALLANSFEMVSEWRRRLLWALDNKVYRDDEDPRPRRALVLLNPFGGAGAAR